MNTPSSFPWLRRLRAATFLASLALSTLSPAAEAAKKTYAIPAGAAAEALAAFTEQSGEQIVYPVDVVRGVRTNAVQGQLSARAALEQLVAGTDLVVVQDASTGALGLRRASDKPAPGTRVMDLQPAVKLQEYRVLGSRIRQTEAEGPTPVSSYDLNYIRSSGALTLADFLKTLPQNYTGVPSGRSSAPNELNPESGLFTESSTPSFNFITNNFDTPLGQTGVSGISLRGLGSGSTLVLVDGRRALQSGAGNRGSSTQQGFVDLNTIPLGMVERIEMITDGASSLYGADAVAGVINIILKKDWQGNELTGTFKGAEHGGGRERSLSLTSGFTAGKLRGTVNVSYYDRAALKASQRRFSKNQDHRAIVAGYDATGAPVYGRDRRLNWGYPAVVMARLGTLAGLTDPNGNPTRYAMLRSGVTGTPTLADFVGVTATTASGLQKGSTAAFDDLIPASERYSVGGNFNYTVNEHLELYARYSFSDTRSKTDTQPGVTGAATSSGFGNFASVVPAAYNPFGQDIAVGMMHPEFGSVWQRVHTQAHNFLVGATGSVGRTWRWDAGLNYQEQDVFQLTRNFNGAAITAALSNADTSLRLNPFIDARVAGVTQDAVYERLAIYPAVASGSQGTSFDFSADGSLFDIWGGPVQLAAGGSYAHFENDSTATNYSIAATPVVTTTTVAGARESFAAFSELNVPLFGKPNARTLLRRLDLNVSARYEDQDSAGHTTVPKFGASWAPFQSVLLRASYSEGYRAPALTEYQTANTTGTASGIIDPRRNETYSVTVTRGSNASVKPETSSTTFYGLVYEPAFAKGLNLQVNYYRTVQQDVIQVPSAQTIVSNEALFPGRIVRAASADALPGRISTVDITYANFGDVRNESLDFVVDYTLPWEQLGRWRVTANASHVLAAERNLRPGVPLADDNGDTYSPPDWNFITSLFWNRGAWSGSAFATYLSGFNTNSGGNIWTNNTAIVSSIYPSVWKLDLRGGYEFKNGVWRGRGKNLRIQAGISNVFDKEPPFADNMYGYNGSLHSQWVLGRSYEISFVLPF